MKKNSYFVLIALVAIILGTMALSSCSHDEYYYIYRK